MTSTELVPSAAARPAALLPAAVGYLSPLLGSPLRLGSRTSPMAMAQARDVRARLTALLPGLEVTVKGITTSADQWEGDLAALGGKGAFTKEIDRALLTGEIDAAVHCMKDVPGDVHHPGRAARARDGGEFAHAMEWGPASQPAELGAYIAGVLLRKGARDLIMGIPH